MANQSIYQAFERMWQHIIAKIGSKADSEHTHDDRYYTEDEIDSKLLGKSDTSHKHDSDYEAKGEVSTHNTASNAHNDIRNLITGLTNRLNALANSTDEDLDQMAEIVAYIKSNKGLIDSITTSKVSVSDIIDNLTTNVSNKPLSAAQGVAIKALIDALGDAIDGKADEEHTHTIADVSGLQSALDSKASNTAAGTNLGLVKSGGDVTINSGVITVNDDSHNHVISNVDGLQSALDGKLSISGTAAMATADAAGNVIAFTYETKDIVENKILLAKLALQEEIADKTRVQIITWEAND